jgi:hypothetical protein
MMRIIFTVLIAISLTSCEPTDTKPFADVVSFGHGNFISVYLIMQSQVKSTNVEATAKGLNIEINQTKRGIETTTVDIVNNIMHAGDDSIELIAGTENLLLIGIGKVEDTVILQFQKTFAKAPQPQHFPSGRVIAENYTTRNGDRMKFRVFRSDNKLSLVLSVQPKDIDFKQIPDVPINLFDFNNNAFNVEFNTGTRTIKHSFPLAKVVNVNEKVQNNGIGLVFGSRLIMGSIF